MAVAPRRFARFFWAAVTVLFALVAGALVAGINGSLATAAVVTVLVTVPGIVAERWSE